MIGRIRLQGTPHFKVGEFQVFKMGPLGIILGLNREQMPSYVLKSPLQSSSGPSPGFKPGLTPGDGVRSAPGRDLNVPMELQLSLEHHFLTVRRGRGAQLWPHGLLRQVHAHRLNYVVVVFF